MRHRNLFIAVLIVSLSSTGCGLFNSSEFSLEKTIKNRPNNKDLLFDYANILEDTQEYSNKYLGVIKNNYQIEAIIVSVPSLEDVRTIGGLSVELFENWKIGKKYNGRGILLLLADKEKKIKLGVSKELEDVFTDAFCGYVEDLQIKPYFTSGQIGTGLLALMEEMEKRAQIKYKGNYKAEDILRLDDDFLTSGAGAQRDLTKYQDQDFNEAGGKYPAGATPDEAWSTMIKSWKDRVRDNNLGVYTEMTKLAYRDYTNMNNSYYDEQIRTYENKDYEVIKDDDYAVIFFGNKQGWDNSPFLFARTDEGWKFDIVYQRKYIRMGPAPSWGMERANYPYAGLLSKCPYYMGQDIPLEGDDVYEIKDDRKIAEKIKNLEEKYKSAPDEFNTLMELGYLYTKVASGQKARPLLKKAKSLNPSSSLPYKCLAIVHVDTTYQYNSAIKELTEYVKREPADVFARNYLGYLYLKIKKYDAAIKELEEAVKLRSNNSYAYCKLSRTYAQLYLDASDRDMRKTSYKNDALKMLANAENVSNFDALRIGWLKRWLKENGIKK